jgi:hypothetical protein
LNVIPDWNEKPIRNKAAGYIYNTNHYKIKTCNKALIFRNRVSRRLQAVYATPVTQIMMHGDISFASRWT